MGNFLDFIVERADSETAKKLQSSSKEILKQFVKQYEHFKTTPLSPHKQGNDFYYEPHFEDGVVSHDGIVITVNVPQEVGTDAEYIGGYVPQIILYDPFWGRHMEQLTKIEELYNNNLNLYGPDKKQQRILNDKKNLVLDLLIPYVQNIIDSPRPHKIVSSLVHELAHHYDFTTRGDPERGYKSEELAVKKAYEPRRSGTPKTHEDVRAEYARQYYRSDHETHAYLIQALSDLLSEDPDQYDSFNSFMKDYVKRIGRRQWDILRYKQQRKIINRLYQAYDKFKN